MTKNIARREYDPARVPTDFSTWERASLERFARHAADDNRELRAEVRAALDAYRNLIREQPPR